MTDQLNSSPFSFSANGSQPKPMENINSNPITTAVQRTFERKLLKEFSSKTGDLRWEANEGETSHRLVWYAKQADGSLKAWDGQHDISLNQYHHARMGLDALAKGIEGKLLGNGTVIFTAPAEKLEWDWGMGGMGWVFGDYQNDFVLPMPDGSSLAVEFDIKDLPRAGRLGVKQIFLSAGELSLGQEEFLLNGDIESSKTFAYALAMRGLLSGINVSVSVGPFLLEKAQGVVAMFEAPDKQAANATRQWLNRSASRTRMEIVQGVQEARALDVLAGGQGNPVPEDEHIMVPTTKNGEIDLLVFVKTSKILPVVNKDGMAMNAITLQISKLQLKQVQRVMRQNGFLANI